MCDPIRNWPISGNLDIKGFLESPKVLGWFGNIIKAHLSAASNDEIAGFFEGSEKQLELENTATSDKLKI